MDADAGVALTETDKEKSIDEAKPAEPLPDMGFSPDMDETGAATPLLEHEDFDWVRALLEREEVHRAQNPSASGDERR